MGLYREVMRANAPVLKFHQEFYGDYERFNSLEAPDSAAIANFQMKKLMENHIFVLLWTQNTALEVVLRL